MWTGKEALPTHVTHMKVGGILLCIDMSSKLKFGVSDALLKSVAEN
jgi:hypothetical protein